METRVSEETVEAVKYSVEICLDFIHSRYLYIEEFFVPSHGIAFNHMQGSLNFFECQEPRYLIRTGTELLPETITQLSRSNDPHLQRLLSQ